MLCITLWAEPCASSHHSTVIFFKVLKIRAFRGGRNRQRIALPSWG